MDGDHPIKRVYDFRPGDFVAIKSRAACSNIHFILPSAPDFNPAKCYDLTGTVQSVLPSGDVKAYFHRDIFCAIQPDALVKIPRLGAGALVNVVDDIRHGGHLNVEIEGYTGSLTEICGCIGVVLEDSEDCPDKILVTFGQSHGVFGRFHLDVVARPLLDHYTTKWTRYGHGRPDLLAEALLIALQNSMLDLPDAHLSFNKRSSIYAPGDRVRVSGEIAEFIAWLKIHYPAKTDAAMSDEHHYGKMPKPPPSKSRSEPSRSEEPEGAQTPSARIPPPAIEEVSTLLQIGTVLHVNFDGEVIVQFCDDCVWSIKSSFLKSMDTSDACGQGRCFSNKLSEAVADFVYSHLGIPKLKPFAEEREEYLFLACFSGYKEFLERMVARGMDVNCKDTSGNTPLHYAAHGNQPEIIQFLLSSEANINATNNRHHTALHFAIKEDFVESVGKLLNHRSTLDLNIQDDSGNTALHVAIVSMNQEIIDQLVTLPNVDFTLTNKYGLNSLHTAALTGNSALVEKVLSKNRDIVNVQQDDGGWSALHFAAYGGHYDVVETLLKQESCVVDLNNGQKDTALLLAARKGHWRIVECLLQAGANMNARDRHGSTALHMSLKNRTDPQEKRLHMPNSRAMKVVYRMESKPRGMCIIINNVDFPGDCKPRKGSEIDARLMETLFRDFYFKVIVETNLSAKDMLQVLSLAAKAKEQSKADCLVVIVMSHGSKNVVLGADGKALHLRNQIYSSFNNANCPALKGKPKLFFVQVCDGGNNNYATDNAQHFTAADTAPPDSLPKWSDMYCAYATIPEYMAVRDQEMGSWFFSAVYDVFSQHASTTDLEGLMRKVASQVMQLSAPGKLMQTPNTETYGWRKQLYFNPGN